MAFSGIPNKGEQKQKCSSTKENKIRSSCLTPTFLGAQRVRTITSPVRLLVQGTRETPVGTACGRIPKPGAP